MTDVIIGCHEEEEMKLTEENQKWVHTQIDDRLDRRIPTPQSGWKRAGHIITSWGAPVAIISVCVTLFGITCASLYQSFSHVKEETEFRTQTRNDIAITRSDVADIRNKIDKFIEQSVKGPLRVSSELPANQFDSSLATIAAQLHSAVQNFIPPDTATLTRISDRIKDSAQTSHSYWTALGALASAMSLTGKRPDELKLLAALPDCKQPTYGSFVGTNFTYNDCAVVLDGWDFKDSIFRDLVIKYRGGPVMLKNVRFINCVFIFELPVNPPAPAKFLTRQLIAKTSSDIVLNSSGA